MPAWIDLSEHKVALNVKSTPDGRALLLRPLFPGVVIPEGVVEIGFTPVGEGCFERTDLRFTLPQMQRIFPLAAARDLSLEEIFDTTGPAKSTTPEVAPPSSLAQPLAVARPPWVVSAKRFASEAIFVAKDGGSLVFDGVSWPAPGASTAQAKRRFHSALVEEALQRSMEGRPMPAPFDNGVAPAPSLTALVDNPDILFPALNAGRGAGRSVCRLLSALESNNSGLLARLMHGQEAHFRLTNPPYEDLVVERHRVGDSDHLYLTHYLKMGGDTVLDAEMVFHIARQRSGSFMMRLAETATINPFGGGEMRGMDVSFARTFSKNLLDQGFAQARVTWPGPDTPGDRSAMAEAARSVGSIVSESDGQVELLFAGRAATIVVERGGYSAFIADVGESSPVFEDATEVARWLRQRATAKAPFYLKSEIFDDSGHRFPDRWVGVVADASDATRFWLIGREGDERSFELLEARDYISALAEASTALAADPAPSGKAEEVLPPPPESPEGYAFLLSEIAAGKDAPPDALEATDKIFRRRWDELREALLAQGWEGSGPSRKAIFRSSHDEGFMAQLLLRGLSPDGSRVTLESPGEAKVIGMAVAWESKGGRGLLRDDMKTDPPGLAALVSDHARSGLTVGKATQTMQDSFANDLMDRWALSGREPSHQLATRRASAFFAELAEYDNDSLEARLKPVVGQAGREWFERLTGVHLGETAEDMRSALGVWSQAGVLKSQGLADASIGPQWERDLRVGILADARRAWEDAVRDQPPLVRYAHGFWQLCRALWGSPEKESAFPDVVKKAVYALGDTLRFGQPAAADHPTAWTFERGMKHLSKVAERLAEQLEQADVEKDAGFRDGVRHSRLSYEQDLARFARLQDQARKESEVAGLLALGDRLFINVDESPLRRLSAAHGAYLERIESIMQSLREAAALRDQRAALEEDERVQRQFSPFTGEGLKTPNAAQLGLSRTFRTNSGEPLLRLAGASGWTNGHMLDLQARPRVVENAIKKYFDPVPGALQEVKEKDILRIVAKAERSARPVAALAFFDPEWKWMPQGGVVLGDAEAGQAVLVDRRYHDYFASVHPGCEFFAPEAAETGEVLVRRNGESIGVISPVRGGALADGLDLLQRALRAGSPAGSTAVAVGEGPSLKDSAISNEKEILRYAKLVVHNHADANTESDRGTPADACSDAETDHRLGRAHPTAAVC